MTASELRFTLPLDRALAGIGELEATARGIRPHRLPAWVRAQFPDGQLMLMEAQPSGGRLVFDTAATRLEVVTHPVRMAYRGADRPRGRIDVVVDGETVEHDALTGGDVILVDLSTGGTEFVPGDDHVTRVDLAAASAATATAARTTGAPDAAPTPGTTRRIEIWLPHNEGLELISVTGDAALEPATASGRTWLHHGSSISHGSNALTPTGTWPAIAARAAGVELVNLGFGGSALVDPFMARVMRDTEADVISVKLGINVVNLDGMRLRTFVPAVHGFLDTIRDGHPDTPLVLISPIFAGIHETTPGPGAVDPASLGTDQVRFIATGSPAEVAAGKLTLEVIRRELASIAERRASDAALHYLDGLTLFGAADAERLPLPDGLHPSADAHRLIGTRFAATGLLDS